MGHGATEHGDRIPHAISETEAAKQRTHPASHADSSWVRPGALWATCPMGQSPGVVSSPSSSQLQRSVSFNSSTERKCMRMYWKYWILGGNWSQIHPCLAVKCLYFQHRAQMSAFPFSCVFHQTAPLNPTRCHEHGHLFCEYEADLAQGVRLPRCPRVAAATARRQNQRSRPDVCRPALLSPCHMPGPGLSRGDSVAAARSSWPPRGHTGHTVTSASSGDMRFSPWRAVLTWNLEEHLRCPCKHDSLSAGSLKLCERDVWREGHPVHWLRCRSTQSSQTGAVQLCAPAP